MRTALRDITDKASGQRNAMPQPKLSDGRKGKRKLEADAAATVRPRAREPEGRMAKTPKRPRRSRIDDNDSDSDNGGSDGRHDLHRGTESGTNGSSNKLLAATSTSNGTAASSSSAAIAALPSSTRAQYAVGAPAPSRSAATAPTANVNVNAPARKSSSFLQHLRRLAQDSMQSNGDFQSESRDRGCEGQGNAININVERDADMMNGTPVACNQEVLCNDTSLLTEETDEDDFNYYNHTSSIHRERTKVQFLLLITAICPIMIMFAFSAILHTQHFNHKILILERDAREALTSYTHSETLKREVGKHKQTRTALQKLHEHVADSQEEILRLKLELATAAETHQMQIQEYKSIFQEHDQELSDAVERIKILRGGKEESSSGIELAWLRMDELMEENHDLSTDLKRARKDALNNDSEVARVQLRDRELIKMVESLSRQLQLVTQEKEDLNKVHEDLLDQSQFMEERYDLLHYNYVEIVDAFLGPILAYVQNLHRTTDHQHSVILELTSLVHSLHASLEINQSSLESQTVQSVRAVDAIAEATNQFSLAKTQQYEMEREQYMTHMETKLERLEDEAMGAVQAVAYAAGKLEYERKIEEEGRWRTYVAEAETILGEIKSLDKIGNNVMRMGTDDDGNGETSVLRAAISRRIEKGVASLRSYIHPYNYLKERETDGGGTMLQIEIENESKEEQ